MAGFISCRRGLIGPATNQPESPGGGGPHAAPSQDCTVIRPHSFQHGGGGFYSKITLPTFSSCKPHSHFVY